MQKEMSSSVLRCVLRLPQHRLQVWHVIATEEGMEAEEDAREHWAWLQANVQEMYEVTPDLEHTSTEALSAVCQGIPTGDIKAYLMYCFHIKAHAPPPQLAHAQPLCSGWQVQQQESLVYSEESKSWHKQEGRSGPAVDAVPPLLVRDTDSAEAAKGRAHLAPERGATAVRAAVSAPVPLAPPAQGGLWRAGAEVVGPEHPDSREAWGLGHHG